ncbi:MAG TPA: hypothetical protein VF479_06300, partial [Pseudolysinimonas sp.]
MKRWLAAAAVFVAVALGVAAPSAALAAPAATAAPTDIDPRCGVFAEPGIFEVLDPSEAVPGLPPQATEFSIACIIDTGSQQIIAYLDDPFTVFIAMAESFAADGWSLLEVDDNGATSPVDLAQLSQRVDEVDLLLQAQRGPDIAGFFYSVDDSGQFGAGTFLIARPLVGPATPSGAGVDDPSTISNLKTIADAAPSPGQTGVLFVSAGLLTLLLAIPAFLLSKVLQSRYQQWFGWLERGRIGRIRKRLAEPGVGPRRWIILAAGMVLAAFIAGFVDPRFGFNGLSVRLFFTLLATFALFNVGAWAVITLVLKRVQPDAKPALTFHPASLLVVAIAVLLSRLLQFDPGVIFGLVAGTTFAVALARSKQAVVIITGTAYAAVVALLAWVIYSVVNVGGPPEGALLVSLSEFLGGVTLEGVATLPIALIPLATLDGAILFAWRRWVWAVSYVIGLALFMLVLFNLPGGDEPVDGDFVRWVLVFVVFAVLAVGVWLADLLVRRRQPEA